VLESFINVQWQEVFYCSVLRPLINLIYVGWTMQEVGVVQ
jgi:hypothetical protein